MGYRLLLEDGGVMRLEDAGGVLLELGEAPGPVGFRTRIAPAPDYPPRRKAGTADPAKSVVKGK